MLPAVCPAVLKYKKFDAELRRQLHTASAQQNKGHRPTYNTHAAPQLADKPSANAAQLPLSLAKLQLPPWRRNICDVGSRHQPGSSVQQCVPYTMHRPFHWQQSRTDHSCTKQDSDPVHRLQSDRRSAGAWVATSPVHAMRCSVAATTQHRTV